MKKGMFREAEAQFKKTIAVFPFYDNAYLELGVAYYKQGKAREAERAWSRAIDINPKNVPAIKFMAIYYGEHKDFNRARQYVKLLQAMGVEPPDDFMKSIGAN
jgi:Tfp pilus assembly protein PilF